MTEQTIDQTQIHTCGRCGDRVRWNGQKWTTVDEPVGACLSGLGFDHRPAGETS